MTTYQKLLTFLIAGARACKDIADLAHNAASWVSDAAWNERQRSHDDARTEPKSCYCRQGENCIICRLVPLNVRCHRPYCHWRGTEREIHVCHQGWGN